jgi:hypothetical protein
MRRINKIGFIIVGHQSEKYSPNGNNFTRNCIESIISLNLSNVHISYIDNQSTDRMYPQNEYVNKCEFSYKYIEDQFKNNGISGAWEDGTKLTIENNCDLIINTNYDTEFNSSIYNFISDIENDIDMDITVYGPLTNEPGFQLHQFSNEFDITKKDEKTFKYLPESAIDALNGFCFAYTNKFSDNFSVDNRLFGSQHFDKSEFIQRKWKQLGAKIKISNNFFVFHDKQGSWRNLYK